MLKQDTERGATMTEYAIVTAFVVILSTIGIAKFGASEVEAISTSGDAAVNAAGGLKHDNGDPMTFTEIMEKVGHPLVAAGPYHPGGNPSGSNSGSNSGPR